MVGILVSFWDGLFSGAMLVPGRVKISLFQSLFHRFFCLRRVFLCRCLANRCRRCRSRSTASGRKKSKKKRRSSGNLRRVGLRLERSKHRQTELHLHCLILHDPPQYEPYIFIYIYIYTVYITSAKQNL